MIALITFNDSAGIKKLRLVIIIVLKLNDLNLQ